MATKSRKVTQNAPASAVGKAIRRTTGRVTVSRSAASGSFAVKKSSGKKKR